MTGKRTFANLADVENPAENLVGIAQAASQGAITAKQLDERPLMRDGEVLETVPGLIVTQHSGEGKANQYFLRGFNLDHGTDFATTVAGMPVNMPTHAHGQGYTDLNFLIPELVTGVQFSKGPYYADQGDFATAGSSNINYANALERSIARVEVGGEGFARGLFAASPARRPRPPCRRAGTRAQRRTVGDARRLPQSQRRHALQPGRRRQRLLDHGDGLSRRLELDRPGRPARHSVRADRSIRVDRLRRTAVIRIATA